MELATSSTRAVQQAFAAKAARLRTAAALEVEERALGDVHTTRVPVDPTPVGWKLGPNFVGLVPEMHNTAACEICQRPYDERQDIGD